MFTNNIFIFSKEYGSKHKNVAAALNTHWVLSVADNTIHQKNLISLYYIPLRIDSIELARSALSCKTGFDCIVGFVAGVGFGCVGGSEDTPLEA